MHNHGKLGEQLAIDSEVLTITSAAGDTSLNYNMADCSKAHFAVSVLGNYSTITVDLMQSSDSTVAGTSAAGGSVGKTIGGPSTLVPVTGGVREMTITLSSASTTNGFFTMSLGTVTKKFAYSTSTAENAATAQSSTKLFYGSTVGSTVNTGLALSAGALATAIISTLAFGNILKCSTPTTATVMVQVMDDATGSLGLQSTAAVASAEVNQAVVGFDIKNDELSTGKEYVGVKVSTASTACKAGVCVIRSGLRYTQSTYAGCLAT